MDKIEKFIHKRFPDDCNWLSGNCYHFASILKSVFQGDLYYDVIIGHFLFYSVETNEFYDWTGRVSEFGFLVKWDDFDNYDPFQKQRIIRDCIA